MTWTTELARSRRAHPRELAGRSNGDAGGGAATARGLRGGWGGGPDSSRIRLSLGAPMGRRLNALRGSLRVLIFLFARPACGQSACAAVQREVAWEWRITTPGGLGIRTRGGMRGPAPVAPPPLRPGGVGPASGDHVRQRLPPWQRGAFPPLSVLWGVGGGSLPRTRPSRRRPGHILTYFSFGRSCRFRPRGNKQVGAHSAEQRRQQWCLAFCTCASTCGTAAPPCRAVVAGVATPSHADQSPPPPLRLAPPSPILSAPPRSRHGGRGLCEEAAVGRW